MDGAVAPLPSWLELWNEWEIQTVVAASFSLQVILFFFARIRRYNVSSVLRVLLWLVYLLADVVATYALGHMSSSLSKKSSSEHQLVAFWAPFLLLHLGGQDTITAYALEDNELWLRHLLNMFVQVACTAYVLYKYIVAGGVTFVHTAMLVFAAGVFKYSERIWALKLASKGGSPYIGRRKRRLHTFRRWIYRIRHKYFTKKHVDVRAYEPSDTLTKKPSDTNTRSTFAQAMKRARRAKMVLSIPHLKSPWVEKTVEIEEGEEGDCFTKNKQFRTDVFIVMTAHVLRQVLVKPLIIDRNEASIDWDNHRIALLKKGLAREHQWESDQSKDALAKEKSHIGEMFKKIEVQLALMYDMMYTKAEVIHTGYGHCIRAISLVSCFATLVVFTKSKRDWYSTPDIVITFALLGGACALEMASILKAIGSTWTCASLRRGKWKWLANAVLFARYHILVVKDGRWSNSVGQFDFISFCVHSRKMDLKVRMARLIGLRDLWHKVRCTKHAKLSPAVKEFVWGLLRGDKSHMVRIEEVDIRSGNWARRFSGVAQIKQLDWSLSYGFHKSVLIWHIATSTFLNNPAVKSKLVDKDMAEAVNTLSDYMMYLLIEHRDILPIKAAAKDMFEETGLCYGLHMEGLSRPVYSFEKEEGLNRPIFSFEEDYPRPLHQSDACRHPEPNVVDSHQVILDYNKGSRHLKDEPDGVLAERLKYIEELYGDLTHPSWDDHRGDAVLVKACTLAHAMLNMELELGLAHMMPIIGTVWVEMLCHAATNASGGFHARQLSNGGEFLTHILLLTKYSYAINKKPAKPYIKPDEAVEASASGNVVINVDDGCNDEITEIHPI
ncbi:hypothetical protein CFC21_105684 [Triticum aestivum]|uniref:DUF4220 domain-containing protein n=3 Tax=Triticum TaxID=4564 RepID=A0A9R1AEX9_TRITD|nr:uncharacterized protein LOC123163091 [Triticum aestivum]KAF7104816.1 hypothetical protein CFC21_105684 [Triticum aestivum]VAI93508.1 unnamed protein product [Triticum turgidum subsp. durum]